MIYVCLATHDNASSVGLLLWKLRKVFEEFPREYHILVADGGSTDGTRDLLETYQRALPMTLVASPAGPGYAALLETLFRDALGRSDRPRRDAVATLPSDFSVSPAVLPDLIKRFDSGADVVIGEAASPVHPFALRLVRRSAPWLLRPGINLPGVRDFLSGTAVIRLVTLKNWMRDRAERLLDTDGFVARAELIARAAANARQVSTVALQDRPNGGGRRPAPAALGLAVQLLRTGRSLRIPAPDAPVQRS